MDFLGTLNNLKTGITEIIKEINSLKNIHTITLTQLPTYMESVIALQNSIENLYSILIFEIPPQHELRLVLLKTLDIEINSLSKILKYCLNWHDNLTSNACCYVYRIKTIIVDQPTSIEKKLTIGFEKIIPLIKDMIKLEHDILGTAIRIKHPILKRAWVNVGGNQLNDNDISVNMLSQSLYVMLKKEENGNLKREEYCKKMIENFIRYIDTLAGTSSDSRISITELCEFKTTPENSLSVKALLGIVKQPNDEIFKQINIPFESPVKINHTHPILETKFRGYGCDWPTQVACEFVVPNISTEDSSDELTFFGINVICNAIDQGFGGTGHAQVRFQVNEEASIPAFSIWRDKVPDNIYKFTIGPDKVKIGDTVKIWLACPPWNAWCMTLNSIKASAVFA